VTPWQLLLVGLAAAFLSSGVVWASIRLAHRYGIYDHPDQARKTQVVPIPRLGGLAVVIAFVVSVLAALAALGRWGQLALAASVLIPAMGMALVGFLDDKRSLAPYPRLAMQASLAVLAIVLGTRIQIFGNVWVDGLLFVLWAVILVNGINLLDNSDGLAATTVMVGAVGATVIGALNGQILISLMGAALAGVSLGFLFHNWFPARVYMGDAGAYFLGFMLAVLTVRLRPEGSTAIEGVAIAVLLAALPIADTAFVVVTRVRRGVHPFTAGRDHLSHRIQARGRSVPASVLVLQGTLVITVGAAIWLSL
jgi:UDP-GlcNAc:undecaprenyl-phosphate GlcNAc-1-phosphate transferase